MKEQPKMFKKFSLSMNLEDQISKITKLQMRIYLSMMLKRIRLSTRLSKLKTCLDIKILLKPSAGVSWWAACLVCIVIIDQGIFRGL
jgi:hypothetical protein